MFDKFALSEKVSRVDAVNVMAVCSVFNKYTSHIGDDKPFVGNTNY